MIPGVTTQQRLPRLGKVRLGEKVKRDGKEYPSKLDHFNFTDVPELAEKFGNNCVEIFPVMLPHNDEEVFFPTARKAYGSGTGLFCASDDGETARRVYSEKDKQGQAFLAGRRDQTGEAFPEVGEMFDMPCPGEDCPLFEKKLCRNIGRLFFFVPDVPRFGVYEIATTSYNSIVNVLSTARAIRTLLGGKIAGVPLALKLVPMQVQPEGRKQTIYALQLECRASFQELAGMGRRLALAGGSPLALIENVKDDLPDDLMPHAGQVLDAELGIAPPPPPADPYAADLAEMRAAGAALGMSEGQIDATALRTPPEHYSSQANEWRELAKSRPAAAPAAARPATGPRPVTTAPVRSAGPPARPAAAPATAAEAGAFDF